MLKKLKLNGFMKTYKTFYPRPLCVFPQMRLNAQIAAALVKAQLFSCVSSVILTRLPHAHF